MQPNATNLPGLPDPSQSRDQSLGMEEQELEQTVFQVCMFGTRYLNMRDEVYMRYDDETVFNNIAATKF